MDNSKEDYLVDKSTSKFSVWFKVQGFSIRFF